MDRAGLIAFWEQRIKEFSYEPYDAKDYILRMSSGTSGQGPMLSLMTVTPIALTDWFAGEGRVALCFGTRSIRLFNLLGSLRAGLDALAIDTVDLVPERLASIEAFQPTRFHGFPSFILRVASQLSPATRSNVVSLRLVGELVTESIEQALVSAFPNAQIRATYAASEIGGITRTSCGFLPRNHYHPQPGVEIAIADPDEQGVGEVVISKTIRGERIDGYRSGDLARLYGIDCACGATQGLQMFGRAGFDYLKLAGGMLRIGEFDRVLATLRPLVADFRIEATTLVEGGVPKGKVRAILYTPSLPTEARQREVAELIAKGVHATPTRTLAQLAAEGYFEPLETTFTDERFPESLKTMRMRYLS